MAGTTGPDTTKARELIGEARQALRELTRKRKVARERIAEHFGDVLRESGSVLVDCGPELGHCYAFNRPGGVGFDIRWLNQNQVRTLPGRID